MQALIETIEKSKMFLDLLLNGILPRQEITKLESDTLSLKCIIPIYISKIAKLSRWYALFERHVPRRFQESEI